MSWFKTYQGFLFRQVDARVYQLFRVVFGLAIAFNWIDLCRYRYQLFSNAGMIDPAYVAGVVKGQGYFSLFYHFHTSYQVDVIFFITGVAIFLMIIGLFSRIAIGWLYIFHLSYINLAFPAISGWDSILTIYLFLLLLSPLSGPWSVDRIWRRRLFKIPAHNTSPAYGLYLMRFQLAVIYLSTAVLKSYDVFWQNGDFFAYFMLSIYSRYASLYFTEHMWLSKLLTWATLVIEFFIPVLLFIKRWRWLGFVLGFALHIGILLSSNLTIFSITMLTLYIPFLNHIGLGQPSNKPANWRIKVVKG